MGRLKSLVTGLRKGSNPDANAGLIKEQLLSFLDKVTSHRLPNFEESVAEFFKANGPALKSQKENYAWFFFNLVSSPREEEALYIFQKGAQYYDVNLALENSTLLVTAIRNKNYEIAKYFIEKGADLYYRSRDNRTALTYLSRGNHSNHDCDFVKLYFNVIPKSKISHYINSPINSDPSFITFVDNSICEVCRELCKKLGGKSGEQLKNETYSQRLQQWKRDELITLGRTLKKRKFVPKYPIIIVPGTCSSKMEVWQSPIWERGTLLWTSPSKMGFSGGHFLTRKVKKSDEVDFVNHMKLDADGKSDPQDISVRPIDGLRGCDYLCNRSAMRDMEINGVSYRETSVVHGNFIRVLVDVGYTDKNLSAFTYDWRLSPFNLEERDRKLLQLKMQIEFTRISNNEKVLLVGHSQGGKFIHYFLYWAEANFGRAWIDENIEGLIGLGIPWLGAPKAIRGVISGDNMGLPTTILLGDGYMLSMCRTYSSVPWLFPLKYHEKCFFIRSDKESKKKVEQIKNLDELNSLDGIDALNEAEVQKSLKYWAEYLRDPHYGRMVNGEMVALLPPPVSKIYNIYGVDRDTEIGAVYKLAKDPEQVGGESTKYIVDDSVQIDNPEDDYYVKAGIVFERATPNKHSGDKTVPFESLSYPKHWKNIEDGPVIKTYEFKLSGSSVDHRSMVSEPVILELVVEIACGGKVVDKLLSTQRIVYEMEWIELSTNEKNVPVFLSTCFESLKLAGSVYNLFSGSNRVQAEVSDIGMLPAEQLKVANFKDINPSSIAWGVMKLFRGQSTPYFTNDQVTDMILVYEKEFDKNRWASSVIGIFESFEPKKRAAGGALMEFLHYLVNEDPTANSLESVSYLFGSKLFSKEKSEEEMIVEKPRDLASLSFTTIDLPVWDSDEMIFTQEEKSFVLQQLIQNYPLYSSAF